MLDAGLSRWMESLAMLTQRLRDEHHQLLPHVRQFRELADMVGDAPIDALAQGVDEAHRFITHELLPHAEAEDRVLYPAVARLMGAAEATRAMSRDHLAINRMGSELADLRDAFRASPAGDAHLKALRRVLYGLHAVVTLHFAKEEEIYLPLLETRLSEHKMNDLLAAMEAAARQVKQGAARMQKPSA
jgi:iron-sulfur cluster repair protein YtfE (RIC family)